MNQVDNTYTDEEIKAFRAEQRKLLDTVKLLESNQLDVPEALTVRRNQLLAILMAVDENLQSEAYNVGTAVAEANWERVQELRGEIAERLAEIDVLIFGRVCDDVRRVFVATDGAYTSYVRPARESSDEAERDARKLQAIQRKSYRINATIKALQDWQRDCADRVAIGLEPRKPSAMWVRRGYVADTGEGFEIVKYPAAPDSAGALNLQPFFDDDDDAEQDDDEQA